MIICYYELVHYQKLPEKNLIDLILDMDFKLEAYCEKADKSYLM